MVIKSPTGCRSLSRLGVMDDMENETFTVYGGQRGGGKIFHLEQMLSVKCAQLKETEIDRDRWKSAALYYRDLYIKQKQEENIMKQYIGTKMIQAEPAYRYWMESGEKVIVAHDEDTPNKVKDATACDDGYKVIYPDGYVSWSPKEVFEEAYRPTDGMNFGLAIEAAKQGKKISRKGWNGRGQYVELASNISYKNTGNEIINAEHKAIGNAALAFVGTSGVQLGWLASQADMLADDWYIVE